MWGDLARASIPRFPALEAESGIKMHQTSGYLGVAGPRYTGFQEWMKASEDYEGKGQAKVYSYLDSLGHNVVPDIIPTILTRFVAQRLCPLT